MRDLIEQCRSRFGDPPRRFPFWNGSYLSPPAPLWMHANRDDPIWTVYREGPSLLREGQVVWGQLIQANQLLFKRGKTDCPADVLFSFDPYFDDDLGALQEIAHQLFTLKGTTPDDAELAKFAHVITDEMSRTSGRAVPPSITGCREMFHSSILVRRLHLPGGYLASGFFPVVACRAAVMILPSRYWPQRLVDLWRMTAR